MKRKYFLSMLMLLGASSLCHAQDKYRIEYDKSGNVLKREKVEILYAYLKGDEYVMEVHDNPTTGPLHIVIKEGRPNRVVDSQVRLLIHPAQGVGGQTEKTFTNGDIHLDISGYSAGVWVVVAFVTIDGREYSTSTKIIKI